jgi:hypothetical protein
MGRPSFTVTLSIAAKREISWRACGGLLAAAHAPSFHGNGNVQLNTEDHSS